MTPELVEREAEMREELGGRRGPWAPLLSRR